jgi:hypothetical protein
VGIPPPGCSDARQVLITGPIGGLSRHTLVE